MKEDQSENITINSSGHLPSQITQLQSNQPPQIIKTVIALHYQFSDLDLQNCDVIKIIQRITQQIGTNIDSVKGWTDKMNQKIQHYKHKQMPIRSHNHIIICSEFMHMLAHHCSTRQIGELSIIFCALLAEGVLNSQIVNYMMLNFIMTYQMVSSHQNQNGILLQNILIIALQLPAMQIYDCKLRKVNIFKFLAYVVCLGNSTLPINIGIINELVKCPFQISQALLEFRNQNDISQVYSCSRKLKNLTVCLIDHLLFKILLNLYLSPNHTVIHKKIYIIIISIIKYDLTLLTVKNLIKKLHILQESHGIHDKWEQIFNLLKLSLTFSTDQDDLRLERQVLCFSRKSTIKVLFDGNKNLQSIRVKFRSFRFDEQLMLCKLLGIRKQIWVTFRNLSDGKFIICVLILKDEIPIDMHKLEIEEDTLKDHLLSMQFTKETINFVFLDRKEQIVSVNNINPKSMLIGGQFEEMGSYLSELSNLTIGYRLQKPQNIINLYCKNPNGIPNIHFKSISLKVKKSSIFLLSKLGDVDLFFLVISHLIKKVNDGPLLLQMIKEVFNFLQNIVKAKKVEGKILQTKQSEKRISNVICLSWLASKLKRPAQVIIQLLGFLTIRKIEEPKELLDVLCNFGLWKQISHKQHYLIIERASRAFGKLNQTQSKVKIEYLKRIILDISIFYRNIQIQRESTQQDYLMKHGQIFQMISTQIKSIQEPLLFTFALDFVSSLIRVIYLLIDRTRYNEFINTILGFNLAKLIIQILLFTRQKYFHSSSKKVNSKTPKSSQRFSPLKRMGEQKILSEDGILMKIQEISDRLRQILQVLKNQLLLGDEGSLKYCDWEDNMKLKYVRQEKIIDICEQMQIILLSFSQKTWEYFNLLYANDVQTKEAEIYWRLNFVQNQDNEQALYYLKIGPIHITLQDQDLIIAIIKRAFSITEFHRGIRLPRKFVQNMKAPQTQPFIDLMCSIYKQAQEQNKSTQQMKQVCEKILFYTCVFPNSFLSNSQKIFEMLEKQKRNQKTVNLVENHLSVRELLKQSFRVLDAHKNKDESFVSTIQGLNWNSDQQGIIQVGKLKKALSEMKQLCIPLEIKKFYELDPTSEEEAAGLLQNFVINIEQIISMLDQKDIECKVSQIRNTIFYLEKHILPFSCMFIDDYIFEQIRMKSKYQQKSKRKKSYRAFKQGKLKEQAENMLKEFLQERRVNMFRVERLWNSVQKNNKYFWEFFFNQSNKHQSLDLTCNSLKMRGLIKIDNEKREIDLPKNIFITSSKISISAESENNEDTHTGESDSSVFDQAMMYEDNMEQITKNSVQKRIRKKQNQFSVIWVTTSKIYQGILICEDSKILFMEEIPDQAYYDLLCAADHQRRTLHQIEKKRQTFQIKINNACTMTPKNYLYYEIAVQIYSQNRTYFICFRKTLKRDKFLKLYQNFPGTIQDEKKLKDLVRIHKKRWLSGDISNFEYLMLLNDLGSRTFDDMSQYYIFPWTVTNFKEKKLDGDFFRNKQNFRQMGKPMGALNEQRLNIVKDRYKESEKYKQTQGFLYGTFYSNPAIVSSYLVRIQPFSTHHFLLQAHKFDFADRMFFSISNQFQACYQNFGDYKQLIPEFYYNPQFLRNRSKYDFGYRQNKKLVHNVDLPEWAHSGPEVYQYEEKFIWLMRRCLQSPYVTSHLHEWIDLIFGVYAKKERAIEKDNLFSPSIYKNELNISQYKQKYQNKQSLFIYFKQFGQIPRNLFQNQHEKNMLDEMETGFPKKLGQEDLIIEYLNEKKTYRKSKMQFYNCENFLFCYDSQQLIVIDYSQDSILTKKVKLDSKIQTIKLFKCQAQGQGRNKNLIFYVRDHKLWVRQMQVKSLLKKSLQISDQIETSLVTHEQKSILEVYESEGFLILGLGSNIKIYKCVFISERGSTQILSSSIQLSLSSKKQLHLELVSEFIQHRAEIEQMKLLKSYGSLFSMDTTRKVYILRMNNNEFQVIHSFRLRRLTLCESIRQSCLHDLGYIFLLTTANNIQMYNMMGDLVTVLSLERLLHLKLLSLEEKISCFQVWNQQTSQLIVATDKGTLIRIDIFLHQDSEILKPSILAHKKKSRRKSFSSIQDRSSMDGIAISFVHANSIGRHWQLIMGSLSNVFKIQSDKFSHAEKRKIQFGKIYPIMS